MINQMKLDFGWNKIEKMEDFVLLESLTDQNPPPLKIYRKILFLLKKRLKDWGGGEVRNLLVYLIK